MAFFFVANFALIGDFQTKISGAAIATSFFFSTSSSFSFQLEQE